VTRSPPNLPAFQNIGASVDELIAMTCEQSAIPAAPPGTPHGGCVAASSNTDSRPEETCRHAVVDSAQPACLAQATGRRAPTLLAAGALAVLALLLSVPGLGNWCLFSPDSFQYLGLARTLVETGGFPPQQLMPPPGYPLAIAPLVAFGDLPMLGLRILFAFCWAGTAAMTYLLHREELGQRPAWLAGLLVAACPSLLQLTLTPLSEPLFTLLAAIAVVIMAAWWRRPVRSAWFVAVGGLLTAAAFMVRSMGLVLLPTMAFALLHHSGQSMARRAVWAGLFAISALGPFAVWQVRQSQYPVGASYSRNWTAAREVEATDATGLRLQLERFRKFGPRRLDAIKEAVLPKDLAWRAFDKPLNKPATWLIGGFFVVVAAVRSIRLRNPVDLYLLLTLLMLSLWPWDEGVRFAAPLIPVLVGYPLWVGLLIWRRAGGRRGVRPVLISALLLWLAVQAAGMAVAQSRLPALETKARHRLQEMSSIAAWHEAHTPPAAMWIGVTAQGDDGKVLLLGAAYLAHRPVSMIAVRDRSAYLLDLSEGQRAFVSRPLADLTRQRWGYVPVATEAGFVVFERSAHP
jgi:hypothetical protein